MILDDSVALVTGAQSGLGFAVAEHLLSLGVKVAALDLNVEEDKFAGNFESERYQLLAVDVSHSGQAEAAFTRIAEKFKKIDICINCAGVAPAAKVLDRDGRAQSLDAFSKVISVNLLGTFNICRLAAELMQHNEPDSQAGERGVIINTASIAAYEGQKGQCAYAASKGGIASMTLPLARDLEKYGIRVNAIAPGVMGTPLMLGMPEKVKDQLEQNVPFPKRMGLPSEFAELVEHIISNPYINAETIRLDGGLRMH